MKIKLILSCLITVVALIALRPHQALANEGSFFLQSTLNNDSQCLAYSVEVKSDEYHLLITCRGLVYPPLPPDSDSYILWADGGAVRTPVKLTNLLFGKGSATIKSKFDRIFVTLEGGNPKQPTGPTIMSATLKPYEFTQLSSNNRPTPASNVSISNTTQPQITPTPQTIKQPFWQTGLGKLIIIITGGFLIFLFILMVYGKRK